MKTTEGIDYYYNAEGNMVLTSHYLSKRGYCCGNACLNCPYDFENVPEPKKTKALEQRKKNNPDKQ